MNVDFLMKTNPFNIPGIQLPKSSESEIKQTDGAQQAAPTQTRAPSGANFVQKIKDTNDAVGFIQTAEAFLSKLDKEGINNFADAAASAKSFSFTGKSVDSKQSFDTTAGVIQVDLTSSEVGFGGDFEEWKTNAKNLLKSKKEQISNPLAAFGAQKKEQMDNAAQKLNNSQNNAKLGSFFDDINETLSSFEKQANDLGNTLF
jgi:hypothetical protein